MKTDYTDISIVLDRSGSMASVADDTIGGLNQFIEDQKYVKGSATISIYQFDHEYEVVCEAMDINSVLKLNKDNYIPRGMTALLDAIGRTINITSDRLKNTPEDQLPSKVLFVIQTDGQENCSNKFKREKIFEMIKDKTDNDKWEFVFLGANQDAIATATTFGIKCSSSMTYAATKGGSDKLYKSLSDKVTSFRCCTSSDASVTFDDEDRKAQKDELDKEVRKR